MENESRTPRIHSNARLEICTTQDMRRHPLLHNLNGLQRRVRPVQQSSIPRRFCVQAWTTWLLESGYSGKTRPAGQDIYQRREPRRRHKRQMRNNRLNCHRQEKRRRAGCMKRKQRNPDEMGASQAREWQSRVPDFIRDSEPNSSINERSGSTLGCVW
jgi:hypothetical protein